MAYKTENVIFGAADIYLAPRVVTKRTGTAPNYTYTYTPVKLPDFTAGSSAKADFDANKGLTGDLAGAWQTIGLTTDGVEVEYAPEFTDIPADQLLDAAVIFKTAQTVTINTTMLEATLKNLAYVWGLQASSLRVGKTTGGDKDFGSVTAINADTGDVTVTEGAALPNGEEVLGIDSGNLGDFPEERQIAFIGSAPRGPMNLKNKERVYHVRRILQTESSTFGLKRDEGTSLPVSFRALPDPGITGAQYGTIRDRRITV